MVYGGMAILQKQGADISHLAENEPMNFNAHRLVAVFVIAFRYLCFNRWEECL